MPSLHHFTLYIHDYIGDRLNLSINVSYYYNDLINDGEIIKIMESIKNIIEIYHGYIFIYMKI